LNAGFVVPAAYQYRAALHTFPHYARALAGMAVVETALGHATSAVRYYRQAIDVVPLPQYVIGLGDLYTMLGKTRAAGREYALISFMNRIFALNHVQFGIEMAQFDADHNRDLPAALRIAQETARERHDIGTMDTFAWVLYKNGRYTQAWKAEKAALRLGTHFAPYYFHAGMIQAALGNVTEAQSYLSSALMLNPNFSVLLAPVARAELLHLNSIATSHNAARK
jgi:tetratricopeptide (TPR) repeat protein